MKQLEHVVIIDDSIKRSSTLAAALHSFGLTVAVNPRFDKTSWDAIGRSGVAAHLNVSAVERIVAELAQQPGWVPIVVYGQPGDQTLALDALKSGAHDFVPWPSDPSLLEARLSSLSENEKRSKQRRRRKIEFGQRLEVLSRREREVLGWIGEGHSSKLIAKEMSISPRTVDIHRANMLRKVGARSSAHAVRIVTEHDGHWATFFSA